MGSKNNLVSVRKSDFEVFQALAKDSEGVISSAQTEYGQEIPPHKPWEKVAGPPILPPHLLQVILNKDTPLSVSCGKKKELFSENLIEISFVITYYFFSVSLLFCLNQITLC